MMDLKSFFQTLEIALSTSDIKGIANAYAEKFLLCTNESSEVVVTDEKFLQQAADFYHRIGVRSTCLRALEETVLDDTHTLANVTWEYVGADGTKIIDFDVTYVLQEKHGSPKIVFFVAHNERERLREKGLL